MQNSRTPEDLSKENPLSRDDRRVGETPPALRQDPNYAFWEGRRTPTMMVALCAAAGPNRRARLPSVARGSKFRGVHQ